MKRVLFDINVVLDVLLQRKPFVDASARSWMLVESSFAEGMLSAHAVTTLHYLIEKELGRAKATSVISSLLQVFRIAPVDEKVIREALQLSSLDFEDAVTIAAARAALCDSIVTRDPKGFRRSPVRAFTPEAFNASVYEGAGDRTST